MKEHIKHASDGMFTVVSVFIGLVFLLFVLMALSSFISSVFAIDLKDPNSVKMMFLFALIGGSVLAFCKIIWEQGKR